MEDDNDIGATDGEARRFNRRAALKKGAVGAGVVGVVWAAPAIEGLSLTPAYASASSGLSTVMCTGSAKFSLTIPCPAPGHSSSDVTPTGNCGIQGITADTRLANAHPHDSVKSVADQFDSVNYNDNPNTNNADAGYPYNNKNKFVVLTVHRNTGNEHCKFTGVTFDGTSPYQFNPTNHNVNGRPTKFNGAFATSDQIQIGFASDPNERADLGQAPCEGTAHISLTCT